MLLHLCNPMFHIFSKKKSMENDFIFFKLALTHLDVKTSLFYYRIGPAVYISSFEYLKIKKSKVSD